MRYANPIRRNRNIGTGKSGHGQDNRLTIPSRGDFRFWEVADGAREVTRTIGERLVRFFVQPTRDDCVHACTIDDIVQLLAHMPASDCEGMEAIYLRQPRRKEHTLAPVWGRLSYAADLVDGAERVIYSGPAIILESVNPNRAFKFGNRLSPTGREEFERLLEDGHSLINSKSNTFQPTLESSRNTQLYRTFLHELGHWVDFLEKVERPALLSPDDDDLYDSLLTHYHARPRTEQEQYAHNYAERHRQRLLEHGVIPFHRKLDDEQLMKDRLRRRDFENGAG